LASAFGALVPIVCGYLRARHRVYCLPTLSESNVLRIQPSFVVTNREIDVLLDGLHAAAELIARQEQHRMILYAHSAHREEPAPPKHAPEGRCLGRFAFLMHPTTQESVNGDAVVAPFDLTEDERAFMRDWLAEFSEWSKPDLDAGVSYRTGKIFNREGDYVEGWLIASLLQPRDLMRLNPSRRRKLLGHYLDAVRKLEIDVLGLGAYTSVISGAGTEMTSERWATTTGNSLTAMIGVESLLSACAGSGRPLAQRIAGVIGAYGSVGRLASLRLARFAERLVLIGNAANTAAMDALRRVGGELYLQALRACRKGETGIGLARVVAPHLPDAATVDSWIDSAHDEPGLRDLFERMDALMRSIAADAAPVTITSDLAHWLPRLEVVLSATSNGTAFIDPTLLHANAILCDCAQPPDIAAAALPQRPDVTVIEGGLIRMPDPTCRFGQQNLTNLPTGVAFSCLAETIVLTMAGKRRDYSIGKSPPLEDAEEIFALAQGFGFAPLPPSRMSAAAASAPDGLSPLAPLPAPIAIASKIATPMVAPTATLASPAPTSLTRTAHMPLQSAFDTAEKRLPGLVGALRARGLMTLEQGEPAALCALARTHRAAGLIIPEALGGTGASPTETVDILRAVGALCPSLAVMLTMHYHTIATMVQLGAIPTAEELLQGVAHHQWLVASAFAEGKPGSAVFNASVKVSPVEGGYALNGTKKPCSMSHDMDVIAVGVARVEGDGSTTEGFAMVINEGSPIAREAFWNTRILRASDSNALVFKDVFVPHERMLMPDAADDIEAAMLAQRAALAGLCWFQLMVGATYLGVASALVERLLAKRKSEDFALAQLAIELEGAHQALIGSARELEALEGADEAAYSRALCVRFLVQGAIERATNLAVELLGGMAFIGSDEVSYLLSASRAICFHPISRTAAAPMLAEFLRGPAEATAPAQTSHVAEANPADIDDSKRIAA
jgi:predicted amino acid dehydrogenase/alkylation response protein AidB-like acyl-CoA dehydrogenase